MLRGVVVKKLVSQLKAGGAKDIVIIGDIILDEYHFGSVTRVSPEAPVPVLKEERREWSLGGAANVAANCKHIGCNVTLIGLVGANDQEGSIVINLLRDLNVSVNGVVRSVDRITTCKKRMLAQNQQLLRLDNEVTQRLSPKELQDITTIIDAVVTPKSTILISDYAKGVITQELVAFIVQRARAMGCVIIVDPKDPHYGLYVGVDYIKPNIKEFKQMAAQFKLPATQSLEENGRALCALLDLRGLIITLGDKGIAYVDANTSFISPACKREVYDLTGAGDTVIAFLGLSIAHGLSMEDCLILANQAAAIAISHVKTYAVSLEELIDYAYESDEKIYEDWTQLKIELDWLRIDGKKVVFTNGCFDILHPGHVQILKEAKKMGDILVVGLNTDESIRRLKGPSRPINDVSYRATMLAALGVVDFVAPFSQDTPYEIIAYVKPDVLVKGGDYQREKIVGYDIVTSYGGSG